MAYTDLITAIYLGTSRITGIAGKNEAGTLTVIAYETEDSAGCIRRGCVYNVKDTAARVKAIIRRMEAKMPGSRVGCLYFGVGGQSIRSVEHTLSKSLETECMVTDELIDSLLAECEAYQPEGLDVLDIIPSAYYLDKQAESDPVGVSCSQIEAKYQLIVARPSIRKRIVEIAHLTQIEIAGILPSPCVLADIVLSEDEKNRGCALIDFGAAVTSLTIYKGGRLHSLWVIPLGGNLITKDLADYLSLGEADAERLKRQYGNAIVDKDDPSTFPADVEPIEMTSVRLADFNAVIEARMQEILENVYARLGSADELKELRAGIVITGRTANLENLTKVIHDRLKTDVRYAAIRKDLEVKGKQSDLSPDGITLGLLLRGEANCVEHTIPKPTPPPLPEQPAAPKPPVDTPPAPPEKEPIENPKPKPASPKRGGLGRDLGKWMGRIFEDE
jgi:cell division protein FtsA